MRAAGCLCLTLALAPVGSCGGVRARADAGFLYSRVSGTVGVATAGVDDSASGVVEADVGEGLGLNGGAGSGYARLELASGPATLALSGFQHDQKGAGSLDVPLGATSIRVPVESSLRLWNLKAMAGYAVLDTEHLRLSPGLALDLVDLDVRTEAPLLGASERLDALLWLPMAALRGEGRLGPLSATLEAGAMTGEVIGSSGRHADLEARLRLRPSAGVELFVGYRWIDLRASLDAAASGSVRLQGWLIGGGLRF